MPTIELLQSSNHVDNDKQCCWFGMHFGSSYTSVQPQRIIDKIYLPLGDTALGNNVKEFGQQSFMHSSGYTKNSNFD